MEEQSAFDAGMMTADACRVDPQSLKSKEKVDDPLAGAPRSSHIRNVALVEAAPTKAEDEMKPTETDSIEKNSDSTHSSRSNHADVRPMRA